MPPSLFMYDTTVVFSVLQVLSCLSRGLGTCFSVAVSKPIKYISCQTRQAGRDSSFSICPGGSATGPVSVRPGQI